MTEYTQGLKVLSPSLHQSHLHGTAGNTLQCIRLFNGFSVYDTSRDSWEKSPIKMDPSTLPDLDCTRYLNYMQADRWVLDEDSNTVYIFMAEEGKLIKYHVDTAEAEDMKVDLPSLSDRELNLQMVTARGVIHIITTGNVVAEKSNTHYMIHIETGSVRQDTFDIIDDEKDEAIIMVSPEHLMYFEDHNQLLLFGCGDCGSELDAKAELSWSNLVFRYDLFWNSWYSNSAWPARGINHNCIQMNLYCSSAVKLADGRHVFISNGWSPHYLGRMTDQIAIYDVDDGIFKLCSVKLSFRKFVFPESVTLRDCGLEKLLASGFIRESLTLPSFQGLQPMPVHIEELIAKWVVIEYVHVLGQIYDDRREHYRIGVDYIMDNLFVPTPIPTSNDCNEDHDESSNYDSGGDASGDGALVLSDSI